MKIKLSGDQASSLQLLSSIGSEGISAIGQILRGAKTAPITAKDMVKLVQGSLDDTARALAKPIVWQILSLYDFGHNEELQPREIVEVLTSAIEDLDPPWNNKEQKKWQEACAPLENLLTISELGTICKSNELSKESSILLRDARIITDIRPVFNNDADKIKATLITHTLRIDYETQSDYQSLDIAVGYNDIESLLQTCQRALQKARIAKDFIDSTTSVKASISGDDE